MDMIQILKNINNDLVEIMELKGKEREQRLQCLQANISGILMGAGVKPETCEAPQPVQPEGEGAV